MVLRSLFFSGVLFLFLGVFFGNTFAEIEKKTDPFQEIDTFITDFAQQIQDSGVREGDQSCHAVSGDKIQPYYKRMMTGVAAQELDLQEVLFSTCYRKTVQRVDQDIQDKIFTPFPTSGMACLDLNGLTPKIDQLISLRKELMNKDLPNNMKKEFCLEDVRGFSFHRTNNMWESLKKKIIAIEEFFDREEPGEADILAQKAEEKRRSQRIEKRATARANSFVDDFVQQSIFEPMYKERSHIRKDLGGLPSGNSRFVTSKTISGSDIFTSQWDFHLNQWADKTKEEIKKNIEELTQKYHKTTPITQLQAVEENLDFEKERADITKKIQKDLANQEQLSDFSEAYSFSIINSLKPFHQTLIETETIMKGNERSLKTVLNKQNVSVTGK